MSLELPSALEPYADDYQQLTNCAGCYALELERKDNLAERWDRHNDHRPEWWEQFRDAPRVFYVGESKYLLSRLEDHRDGEVRVGLLQRVCTISGLEQARFYDSKEDAMHAEYNYAVALKQEYPKAYVHLNGEPV